MTFISYAQNFEDVLLWRALRDIPAGFYIDVGASHPDADSVTRAFYDRGWSGINIEPSGADFRRLEAARPRDVNLNIAAGGQAGVARFFTVPGSGLSTLRPDLLPGIARVGLAHRETEVEIRTLSQICAAHAESEIHFLKIDVEGSEGAVLEGADFERFRPWIVLVEATAPISTEPTHGEWEEILLAADYRFAWFDGLNRFYVSAERWPEMARYFQAPVNVFDDFLRAADSETAQRIATAEANARSGAILQIRYDRAMERIAALTAEKSRAALEAVSIAGERDRAMRDAEGAVRHRLEAMEARLAALLSSTSWRLTRPIRLLKERLPRRRRGETVDAAPPAAISPAAQNMAPGPAAFVFPAATAASQPGAIATVHQFHAGSATGDAITNAMLLTRRILRSLGYASEIFVLHRDPALADELRLFEDIPRGEDYVLIVRHSMGFDGFEAVAGLAARKILFYHNITPAELLAEEPSLRDYSRLGREQLRRWRPLVHAVLADSEYNAAELYALGFANVRTCTLLFDIAKLGRCAGGRAASGVFTILFVGRLVESKGQLELIRAYLRFRDYFDAPSRLVLVGRYDPASRYFERVQNLIAGESLQAHVILTGPVSDLELNDHYADADLYVSLSRHEGFGVPLIEAIASHVPVLAWPAGAIGYRLGAGAGRLHSRETEAVAASLHSVAANPGLRAAILREQRRCLPEFDLAKQIPLLTQSLCIAGAAIPAEHETIARFKANARFVVTGHFTTSYSLAAVNRTLALALENSRPGAVRVVPVGEDLQTLTKGIPPRDRSEILRLAAVQKADCGPVIVISQHYPVHVPSEPGEVPLALFFWEESVIPAATIALLGANFAGVIAPSRFVAKTLVDSGLSIPICTLGWFPDVSAFRALPAAAPDAVFTFLHISSCFPRKGVDLLLRAYAEAFTAGDKVRLVIKGFVNPHNDVARQVAELRARRPDLAEITLIEDELAEDEILSLYAKADAIVLPTRGEGFNLPAAEALAAGIPLIVTGHGGHMDFCDAGNARLLEYRFAGSRSHLASRHSLWVEPDAEDLKAALIDALARPRARRPAAAPEPGEAVLARIEKLEGFAIDTLVRRPPPLAIAWVSSWEVRCGIAAYSKFLVENLAAEGGFAGISVLADMRTPARAGPVPVLPCWRLQEPESLGSLMRAITRTDAGAVVVQHQPGLMSWAMLETLLAALRQREKLVTVTLHNTAHLLDIEPVERQSILAELGRAARVIVHGVADLNRLKSQGLIENTVMIPQGAPARRGVTPARALPPAEAPLIGCYGFFLPGKGIRQLIEGLEILHETWPAARLRLVNAEYGNRESAAEIAACKAFAQAAGLTGFIDWRNDFLPEAESVGLLADCDLIALPYQFSKEASSAALRMALSAGPPVIVTPLALFDEMGDAVLRFSGPTGGEIAAGLGAALGDPAAREASRARAASWISDHSWPEIAKRMQGMLLGLALARRRQPSA